MPLAREHHARVLVLDGDRDVRERLVVPQPHVEGRPVPLDEVLLEVKGLDLVARDDHLDVRDPVGELLDRRAGVRVRLEVRPDARAERLRLAHVEDLALGVLEDVDARAWSGAPSGAVPTVSSLLVASVAVSIVRTGVLKGVVAGVAALSLAPAALAGGPTMVVGTTTDVAKQSDPALAQAEVLRAKAAGFTAIRVTQHWLPDQVEPPGGDLARSRTPCSRRRRTRCRSSSSSRIRAAGRLR